jgi:hypothetical protein
MPKALQDKFLAADLSEAQLDALMEAFIKDVKESKWEANGWPKTTSVLRSPLPSARSLSFLALTRASLRVDGWVGDGRQLRCVQSGCEYADSRGGA